MIDMRRLAFVALLVAQPSAAQTDPVKAIERGLVPAFAPESGAIPRWSLGERMRAYGVPAVSVAVIENGRIAWAHAWGVKRAGGSEAVDTATLFQAASISKPVAALAALSLVQQGRLVLDEDVNVRLRSWRLPAAEATSTERVTLRRLLSHTAGLTVHGFRGYARGEAVPSVVQVLDGAGNSAAVRADLIPGSQWRYSGGGTTVAQLLMMDATGLPFHEFMEATVLAPLGMRSSTYAQPLPADRVANAASGHRSDGSVVAGEWHTYPEQAAAGLWTTPSDLARVALEVQRAYRGESDRILTQATAREMLTEVDGGYGLGFGLGEQGGAPTFSHGGANEGFRAHFFAYQDGGRGAFIMTNSDAGAGLAAEILRGIADLHGWPGPQVRRRATRTVGDGEMARLTGTFAVGTNEIRVEAGDDGLRITLPDGRRVPYLAGADGRWFALSGGPEFEFVIEGDHAGSVRVHGVGPEPIVAERRNR